MKRFFKAGLMLVLPSWAIRALGPVLGIHLKNGARIGFSIIFADHIEIGKSGRIGHFNIIRLKSLYISEGAYIGKRNSIDGRTLDIRIHNRGAIGNRNWVYRAGPPVTYGDAVLEIGKDAKITFRHFIDCTRSVRVGDFSVIAGLGSQIWTHGYFLNDEGLDRIRIDGEVTIANNVNISTGCTINPGVTIAEGITVGSNVCVSKSLSEKGMYVSQGLRFLPRSIDMVREEYSQVLGHDLIEEVYVRREP